MTKTNSYKKEDSRTSVRELTRRTFWGVEVTFSGDTRLVWSSRIRDDVYAVQEFLDNNPRIAHAAWEECGLGRPLPKEAHT